MRNIHRWLSVIFGIFILWIATTGVLSQVAALYANGGFEEEERAAPSATSKPKAAATGNPLIPAASAHNEDPVPVPIALPAPVAVSAAPAAFACPDTMTCRPKAPPSEARAWVSFFHHIHAGEEFGPAGVIVSIMSGLALMFFAISGMWMYYVMYRNRGRRHRTGSRFFWT